MANNIGDWIPQLSKEWNTKFEKFDDGITWAIDVPFTLKDGSLRYQWVYVSYGVGVAKGQDMLDFRSKVGDYSASLNLHGILHEAKYGYYSAVCIREIKRENVSVDVIYVQAGPLAEHVTTYEHFKFILNEVGGNADIIEQKFFGGVDKS